MQDLVDADLAATKEGSFIECINRKRKCRSRTHKQTLKVLTTPAMLLIQGETRLPVQQTLIMKDFQGRPSNYELRAMVCMDGASGDNRYYAEFSTDNGWARCGTDIEMLPPRGGEDILHARLCLMFYQRISPRPDDDGISRGLIDSINRKRPPYVSGTKNMHGCLRDLIHLPEFEVDPEDNRKCVLCQSDEKAVADADPFRALPCRHAFHESCLVRMVD